jgi:two-component system cell cycle response regulator
MIKNIFDLNELKNTNRLPSPSGTALEIMQLLQNDNTKISEIAELVKMDPALSARIIKFVNSAGVSNQRKIMNVNDAIVMVGMATVKNFALSLSLITKDSRDRCNGFSYVSYWSLSLARAIALMAMNRLERVIAPEEAFTFGLLSDIGRLAIASVWSEEYSDCLFSAENEDDLKRLESKLFGIHHDEMSLLLLKDWGFSEMFIESLGASFDNNLSRSNRLATQLIFARQLALYCVSVNSERENLLPNLLTSAKKYNLTRFELLPFLDDLLIQWAEWGNLIDIKTDVPYSKLFFLKNSIS